MRGYYETTTSGTTGKPKTLLRSIERHMAQAAVDVQQLRITEEDRVGSLTPGGPHGLAQMLYTSLAGATLVPWEKESNKELADWVNRERITVLSLVASTYRYLMNIGGRFPSVRLLEVGGEIVDGGDLELFKQRFPDDCVLINRYASRETSVISRWFASKRTPLIDGPLPVGRPIPGVSVSIRNESGSVTQKGEILVRSPYAALGYPNDPELDARTFRDGWCHTGDWGWFDDAGILHHEGRMLG
jgi:iturin family lipopeptide synthetase A